LAIKQNSQTVKTANAEIYSALKSTLSYESITKCAKTSIMSPNTSRETATPLTDGWVRVTNRNPNPNTSRETATPRTNGCYDNDNHSTKHQLSKSITFGDMKGSQNTMWGLLVPQTLLSEQIFTWSPITYIHLPAYKISTS